MNPAFYPLVVEIRFSLLPNRLALLTTEQVARINEIYQSLGVAVVDDSLCWSCEPPRRYHVFLDASPEGQLVVTEDTVARGKAGDARLADRPLGLAETRVDANQAMSGFLNVLMPVDRPGLLEWPRPAGAGTPRRCGAEIPPPRYEPCTCGGPSDFDQWASWVTILNNTCFNFALKDLWCDGGGGSPGTPGSGTIADWNHLLCRMGLVPVRDWHTVPPGEDPSSGWHIALATGPKRDGHFLRLDRADGIWTQKYSTLLPQACDAAGRSIPMDGILAANLCGYCVKAFYWVRSGTTIGG